jgi:hypothetical protein
MTDLEINIAIAEMCGWGFLSKDKFIVIPPNSPYSVQPLSTIPDYVNDLNAMHEAEKMSLSGSTAWLEFAVNLMRVLEAEQMSELNGMTCILQATARHRAEAFLRTVGKWKEQKP